MTSYKIFESSTYYKYTASLITGIEIENMFGLIFLIINSIEYRPGLFIFKNYQLYEIEHIL